MKYLSVALVYLGFFGLIGIAIWITKSPWALLALIFAPSYSEGKDKNKENVDIED